MSTANPYAYRETPVAETPLDVRTDFIRRTYVHFLGGLIAFMGVVWLIGVTPGAVELTASQPVRIGSIVGMIILAFTYRKFFGSQNLAIHYVGFGLTIAIYAALMAPLFLWAEYAVPGVLGKAVLITGAGFGGLTAFALTTKKDLTMLGGALSLMTFGLIGVVCAGWMFGFNIGIWYSYAALIVFGGWVLYDTQQIKTHLAPNQYVFGATMLFIDFVVMLQHVLVILLNNNDD